MVCYKYHFVYCMVCLSIYTAAQQSTVMGYSNTASPYFYKDEKITFTCEAYGYTDLKNVQLQYEADGDSTIYKSGCTKSSEDDTVWISSLTPDINTFSGIEGPGVSDAYCNSISKPEGFPLSVQLTITDPTIRGKFYCRGFDRGGVGEILSPEVSVDVKVAPTGISLNKPENIIEGEEFTFDCISTGADPVSVYEYKVNGNMVAGKYTATEIDRAGLTLSCTDTEHSNWKRGNTEQTVTIKPQYLARKPGVQNPIVINFNPRQSDVKLDCSQYVDANPPPSAFFWKYNGVLMIELSNELVLSSQTDGVTEAVECTPENGLSKTVTIKWNIIWDNAAKISTLLPTITSTTTSVKKPLSNEAVIGAFVGALSGVLITIAVVAIYNKRKSKGKKPHTLITTVPSTYKELSVTRTVDHNYECVDNSQKHGINQIRVSQSEDQDGYEIPITSTYM